MSKFLRISLRVGLAIALLWGILTFYVQGEGPAQSLTFGEADSEHTALILYDPDPFYNLDEQVCLGMAETMSREGWNVQLQTVKAARTGSFQAYDLYLFCANTYNWAPDQAIIGLINNWPQLAGKSAIALTLGSGSTTRAQRLLEEALEVQQVKLLDSRSLWLLRPNDETRMEEKNVDVAVSMAETWIKELITEGI